MIIGNSLVAVSLGFLAHTLFYCASTCSSNDDAQLSKAVHRNLVYC